MKKTILSTILSIFTVLSISNSVLAGKNLKMGDKVMAPMGNELREGTIISGPSKSGQFRIRYKGLDVTRDKWLSPQNIYSFEELEEKNSKLSMNIGDMVDVSRDNKFWVEGKIVEKKYGNYIVTLGNETTTKYDFSPEEVRPLAPVNMTGSPKIGDKVEFENLNKVLVKGIVVDIKDGTYRVQYRHNDFAEVTEDKLNSEAYQAKANDLKQQKDYYDTFYNDASPYADSIKSIALTYNNSYHNVPSNVIWTAEKVKKAKKDLKDLNELIKTKYPNIENPTWFTNSDFRNLGGDWKIIAGDGENLLKKTVSTYVEDKDKTLFSADAKSSYEGYLGMVKGFDSVKEDLNKEYKNLVSVSKEIGGSFTPNWSNYKKTYDNKVAKFLVDVKKRKPIVSDSLGNPYKYHDAAVESVFKTYVLKVDKGSKILKMAVGSSDWKIVYNSIGIPKYMWKPVAALYSNSKYRTCAMYRGAVYKNYTGGGTYGSLYSEYGNSTYVNCN